VSDRIKNRNDVWIDWRTMTQDYIDELYNSMPRRTNTNSFIEPIHSY